MVNYYEILQIEQRAGLADIKRSFRRLLKRFHPDRNQADPAWAAERTRQLVDAYRVLSDERRRRHHDHELRLSRLKFSGGSKLRRPRQHTSSAASQCRRILDGLLNGDGANSVALYESLRGAEPVFDLYPYLGLKDDLDCKFLLGEEYERQEKLREALTLYEQVYREEFEGPRLRYFFEEVQERIVNIYCQELAHEADIAAALRFVAQALKLELPPKDRAEIRKKLAETLLRLGDEEGARRELAEALRIRPGLKGVQRLCARLGLQAAAI